MESKDMMKTGTTTVGVVFKDGVVLGADKRASAGYRVADKKAKKVHQVANNVAVTIAGLVSDAQLLVKLITAEIKLKDVQTLRKTRVKEAAHLLANIQYRNIRVPSMVPGIVGFLMGGYDEAGPQLFEIGIDGSISDVTDFTSDGSGSSYALGVLESQYKPNMSQDEAVKLVTKAINAAMQRDIASGQGVRVVTLTKDGYKEVYDKDVVLNVVA